MTLCKKVKKLRLALFLHLLHKNTGVYYMLPLSCHMAQQCWKQDQTYKTKTRLQDQDQDRGRSETGLVIRPRSQTPRLFTTLCIFFWNNFLLLKMAQKWSWSSIFATRSAKAYIIHVKVRLSKTNVAEINTNRNCSQS